MEWMYYGFFQGRFRGCPELLQSADAEPTYNLYIDGLEPISFEDSSHITLSVRNDFICKIVTDRYLGLLKEAFKTVLGFDVDITLVVPSTVLNASLSRPR